MTKEEKTPENKSNQKNFDITSYVNEIINAAKLRHLTETNQELDIDSIENDNKHNDNQNYTKKVRFLDEKELIDRKIKKWNSIEKEEE